jgi:hypothetical protein
MMHYNLTRCLTVVVPFGRRSQTDGVANALPCPPGIGITSAGDTLITKAGMSIRNAITIRHCQAFRFAEAQRYTPVCSCPVIIILRPIGIANFVRKLGVLCNGDRHMEAEHQQGEGYSHVNILSSQAS